MEEWSSPFQRKGLASLTKLKLVRVCPSSKAAAATAISRTGAIPLLFVLLKTNSARRKKTALYALCSGSKNHVHFGQLKVPAATRGVSPS